MTWTDIYLKAPTKEEFRAAWPWLGEENVPLTAGLDFAMVEIGPLVYGGEWDVDGNQTVAPTVVEGWHVNLRLREGVDMPPSLLPFVIAAPNYPKMVWA